VKLTIVLAVLLAPIAARGQTECFRDCDSPERPVYDRPAKPEPVINREFVADASVMAAAWAADAIHTRSYLSGGTYRHESGAFFPGSRNTAAIMGAWAAVDLGAAVLGYEWKRHVSNRYLHPLWRLPMLIRAGEHVQAIQSTHDVFTR